MTGKYVIVDIETTGLSPENDHITEIGAVKIVNGEEVETFNQLINPGVHIPDKIVEITGISDELVRDKPAIDVVMPQFIAFAEGFAIMGHNILFDYSFLKTNANRLGLRFEKLGLDTLVIAKKYVTETKSKSLTNLCDYYNISRENAHRAFDDAYATYILYTLLVQQYYNGENIRDFSPKPLMYRPKKASGITPKQEKYLRALIEYHQINIEKEVKALSKSEASKMIDRIILHHGRMY